MKSITLSARRRAGITVVEVVAIVLIVIVLWALFVPRLGVPREAARRMTCTSNLRTISVALITYESLHQQLPPGAAHLPPAQAGQPAGWGPSWLAALSSYGQDDSIMGNVRLSPTPEAFGYDYLSSPARQLASGKRHRLLHCPSSPLPPMQSFNGFELMVPSYVGIMGANESRGMAASEVIDPQARIVGGPYEGYAAGNGVLLVNQSTHAGEVASADGCTNTIFISEVSNWYYDAGQKRNPAMSIANAGGGFHNTAGWLAGTDRIEPITAGSPEVAGVRILNLVTIEHGINVNGRAAQEPQWGTQGIGRCGVNNPLSSGHPGGVVVGFRDGHTQFLSDEVNISVLKRLAIRDDGGKSSEDY
jgi:competence protein ComGC